MAKTLIFIIFLIQLCAPANAHLTKIRCDIPLKSLKNEELELALRKNVANYQENQNEEAIVNIFNLLRRTIFFLQRPYRLYVEKDELNQQTLLAIKYSISKFDLDRGTKFHSYARTAIQWRYAKKLRSLKSLVTFPIESVPRLRDLKFKLDELKPLFGSHTTEAIYELLPEDLRKDISYEHFYNYFLYYSTRSISIHSKTHSQDSRAHTFETSFNFDAYNLDEDPQAEVVINVLEKEKIFKTIRKFVKEFSDRLNDRDRLIFEMRIFSAENDIIGDIAGSDKKFVADSGNPTLQNVADILGVKRQTVFTSEQRIKENFKIFIKTKLTYSPEIKAALQGTN